VSTLVELTESQRAVRTRVDELLDTFLSAKVAVEPGHTGPEVLRLVRDFTLNGGKRIRPLFCYWGWRGAGGTLEDDRVITVASALELFHTAALIHDDLIDHSLERRGRPTLHRSLALVHQQADWRGSSEDFGYSSALLAGDACLVWSEEIFRSCPPAKGQERLDALFTLLRTEAIQGESLDIVGEASGASIADATEIIRRKTAGYTVRYPLQIGGVLAGADEALLAGYDAFGLLIGEAFQLRDDLLGFFGAPEVTGKSPLDDARQGKPTVLIAVARQMAGRRQAELIDALYGRPRLDAAEFAELRAAVEETGAREVVEQMIGDRHTDALARLRGVPIQEAALAMLESLAAAAVDREI
jgi:geranylgeranyl diphosphate synthase type I